MRKHSMVMAKIINDKGYRKIAEIGVWKGRFMNGILWVCPHVTEYWGIDSWCDLHDPDYNEPNMAKMTDDEWLETYLFVCHGLKAYPQLKLVRADATKVAQLFPNGYFDVVFIDADHAYEAVKNDIEVWTPKVRKGGIISGHDHFKRYPGVKQAVAEAFGDKFQGLPATCWMKEI